MKPYSVGEGRSNLPGILHGVEGGPPGAIALPVPGGKPPGHGPDRFPPWRCRTDRERFLGNAVLRSSPLLPCDRAATVRHGSGRAHLERQGCHPPTLDGCIAVSARVPGLTLATGHTGEDRLFQGPSRDKGLQP